METISQRYSGMTYLPNHVTSTFDPRMVASTFPFAPALALPEHREGGESEFGGTPEAPSANGVWGEEASTLIQRRTYGPEQATMASPSTLMTSLELNRNLSEAPGTDSYSFHGSTSSPRRREERVLSGSLRDRRDNSDGIPAAAAASTQVYRDADPLPASRQAQASSALEVKGDSFGNVLPSEPFPDHLGFFSPLEHQRRTVAATGLGERSSLPASDEENICQFPFQGTFHTSSSSEFPAQRDSRTAAAEEMSDVELLSGLSMDQWFVASEKAVYHGAGRPGAVSRLPPMKKSSKRRRRRVQTGSQRKAANLRERRRMSHLNEAFQTLKDKLPSIRGKRRLSRIQTLRAAITYIQGLGDLLLTRM